MKAKFKPVDRNKYSSRLVDSQDIVCEWMFQFEIDGVEYYITEDKGFPSSDAFPLTELEVIK